MSEQNLIVEQTREFEPINPSPKYPGKISQHGTHYWIRGGQEGGGTGIIGGGGSPEKAVIVFVHGIGAYYTCFNNLAQHLVQNGFITVQYDLIGRGYSLPSPNQLYGRDEHIAQLHSLLEDLHTTLPPPPYHLIGHSMGGALAALFAHQYPHYIRSLTLLAPAGLLPFLPVGLLVSLPACLKSCIKGTLTNDENAKKAWASDFYEVNKPEVKQIVDDVVNDLTQMNQSNAEMKNAFWQSVLHFPLRKIDREVEELGKRKGLEILLLWGDKDSAVPLSPSYSRWRNYLQINPTKNATGSRKDVAEGCYLEAKIYPNLAHGFFIEATDLVFPDILQFLLKF